MSKVYIVYHSGYGHTKLQAEAVTQGAATVPGTETFLLTTDEAITRLDELDSADAIIFGCPTYMGNVSAEMKKFQEAAASKWFTQAWKDKIAGAFTNSSGFSGDKLNTLVSLTINALQQGMIYVGLGMLPSANEPQGPKTLNGPSVQAHNRYASSVGAMASSFEVRPPEAPGSGDLETAQLYGQRVAIITARFLKGKEA